MASDTINLVICWHMHQPYYRVGQRGEYHLPWVYLHGIKDYTDMAAHLEQNPKMRVVVNFVPLLLEQLHDYSIQLQHYLDNGLPMSDQLLNLLTGVKAIPSDHEGREKLVTDCLRCNSAQMIEPFPIFSSLALWGKEGIKHKDAGGDYPPLEYLSEQYFIDLLVCYHLSWLGYSIKQTEGAKALIKKGHRYSLADRHLLIEIIYHAIAGLIPRYKALAESGQIELSMTPYGHPIVPLLNDFDNMSCAMPDAPKPRAKGYPGGTQRSDWHLKKGLSLFSHHFNLRPAGVWLSEGGISIDALELLQENGIRWTATGEGVWRNSYHLSTEKHEAVHSKRTLFKPHCLQAQRVSVFFRDDGLSDLVGFEYRDWDAQHAVDNFVHHLENITGMFGEEADKHVVSVILDGENAWEYYPDNGYHFLDTLYRALVNHARINPITFDEAEALIEPLELSDFCPGSWVYGSFSAWIGDRDKNLAWDYLVAAKQCYDRVMECGRLSTEAKEQATRQLAICEGSDWFWWFGDYNPPNSVRDFDQLYRQQLRIFYLLLDEPPPEQLEQSLSRGGGHAANAGTMRRN